MSQVFEITSAALPLVRGRSSVQSTPAAPRNQFFFEKLILASRQLPAEQDVNTTLRLVENPWTLFAAFSVRQTRLQYPRMASGPAASLSSIRGRESPVFN